MHFKDLKFKKHSVVEGIQATLEIKPKCIHISSCW